MSISASMLVADRINFDSFNYTHSIGRVLNRLEIPSFPNAVVTDVYLKIRLPNPAFMETAQILVYAPDQMLEVESPIIEIKNYRPYKEFPGMDASMNVRFAAVEEGSYIYRLVIGQNLIVIDYPLYIHASEV
ncbi:hypothetical protein [Fontibacillus sp. BL9]|uniref:hypothetical protein n=1 Tax=Fontibacillus sp. BL9 TaxID=3389971 RepID=UPI00397C544C